MDRVHLSATPEHPAVPRVLLVGHPTALAATAAVALRAAGIAEGDREQADAQTASEAWNAAERFARRKRVGPYATGPLDPKQRDKAIAAFLRAGHDYAMARRWVDAAPGEALAEE